MFNAMHIMGEMPAVSSLSPGEDGELQVSAGYNIRLLGGWMGVLYYNLLGLVVHLLLGSGACNPPSMGLQVPAVRKT